MVWVSYMSFGEPPNREYPESPMVGVGGVVLKDNKVLLAKRSNPPGRGLWSIPGGLVRLGETLREAVKREVMEECGLEVEPISPLKVFDVIEKDEEGKIRFHYVIVDYLCKISKEGTIRPGGDVEEVRWIGIDDALHLDLTKGTRSLIMGLKKRLLVIRNSDIEKVMLGAPKGHKHIRGLIFLKNEVVIVFQQATLENIARGVINLITHPLKRALCLRCVRLENRKGDFAEYQLIEEDRSEEDIINEITFLLAEEQPNL